MGACPVGAAVGFPRRRSYTRPTTCASSSTAEQRTLNPQVLGSKPRGRTIDGNSTGGAGAQTRPPRNGEELRPRVRAEGSSDLCQSTCGGTARHVETRCSLGNAGPVEQE